MVKIKTISRTEEEYVRKSKNDIVIPSHKNSSYVKEHGIDTLDRLADGLEVGNGFVFDYYYYWKWLSAPPQACSQPYTQPFTEPYAQAS